MCWRAWWASAQDMGYVFNVGPELEFYYFKDAEGTELLGPRRLFRPDQPRITPATCDATRCSPLRRWASPWSTAITRTALPSTRSTLRFTDALSMADAVMTYKLVVKEIAMKHGVYASFMPKPLADAPGSVACTCTMSLFDFDGGNAFFDPDDPQGYHLSKVAAKQLPCGHPEVCARSSALITNPCVNSYKRLLAGGEAPIYLSWARAQPLHARARARLPPQSRGGMPFGAAQPRPERQPLPRLRGHAGGGAWPASKRSLSPLRPSRIATCSPQSRQELLVPRASATLPESLGQAVELFSRARSLCVKRSASTSATTWSKPSRPSGTSTRPTCPLGSSTATWRFCNGARDAT